MWDILKPLDLLDNLVPPVKFIVPLPLDAAQNQLQENLNMISQKFSYTSTNETELNKVDENTISFRIRVDNWNINGLLSYQTNTKSLIQCEVKTSRGYKATWILVYSLGNPLIFCGACGIFSEEIKNVFWWGLVAGLPLSLMGFLAWVIRFSADTRFIRKKLIHSLY